MSFSDFSEEEMSDGELEKLAAAFPEDANLQRLIRMKNLPPPTPEQLEEILERMAVYNPDAAQILEERRRSKS